MTRLLDSPLVLIFGGEHPSGHLLNDMYCLNASTCVWRKIHYTTPLLPPPRILHSATPISPTALVIMCGDAAPNTPHNTPNTATRPITDAWLFDLRTASWQQIPPTGHLPPPRSCHSAVFANSLGQVPAIYVFGGFGRGEPEGSAMYRLRVGDWSWERLPVLLTSVDGTDRVVDRPVEDDFAPDQFPSQRESHGAIWLPAKNAMLVVGGDGGFAVLDDAWLFAPCPGRPGVWRWTCLKLRMARGLVVNKLPVCAGVTLVAVPTAKTQVLMWGGIVGCSGEEAMGPGYSVLLDLDAMQTTVLKSSGDVPPSGRLLHGFVRVGGLLLTFGGCDSEGNVLQGLQHARLKPDLKSVGLQATDFGPVAAVVAAGMDGEPGKRVVEEEEEEEKEMLPVPLSIPRGTPLSGRIIDETDYGFFVSVIINGKLYKGVLVANPLKASDARAKRDAPAVEYDEAGAAADPAPAGTRAAPALAATSSAPAPVGTPTAPAPAGTTAASEARPAHAPVVEKMETETVATSPVKSPEPKRPRLDPAVEALPDYPPRLGTKVVEEVIDLD